VDLPDGRREVTARAAGKDERARLLAALAGPFGDFHRYATLRSRETQIVILAPRAAPSEASPASD